MDFGSFLGIMVALGFLIVFLDMRASAKLFKVMRRDISILHARIVVLERDNIKDI